MCGGGGGDPEVKETSDQKAMMDIAKDRYGRYMEITRPAEDQLISRTHNMDSDTYRQSYVDHASTAAQGVFDDAIGGSIDHMTSAGINPNSGTFTNGIDDMTTQAGLGKSDVLNKATVGASDNALQGKANLVMYGNGLATEAIGGLNDVAGLSGQAAQNRAISSHNNTSAKNNMLGQVAGSGFAAYSGLKQDEAI